jgi:hypothetical protein
MKECLSYKTIWHITKYENNDKFDQGISYDTIRIDNNILLNEGITALLNLLIGAAQNAFNNTNANIGVGSSTTVESATDTGLLAVTDKTYKGMEAGYPMIVGQTVTFRSVFGADDANYAWEEFTVANGTSDSADNLNRKTDSQGTKIQGQTWTVDLEITFS